MRNFSSSFSLSGSYRRLRYSIRGTLLNIECALAYHSRARTTQSRQLVAVSITSLQCDCLGRLSRNRAQIVSRREQAVIRNLPKPCGTTSYLSLLCIQSRTFLSLILSYLCNYVLRYKRLTYPHCYVLSTRSYLLYMYYLGDPSIGSRCW